nr:MAG TPA: hypothetical protein [Microviridae sp.]
MQEFIDYILDLLSSALYIFAPLFIFQLFVLLYILIWYGLYNLWYVLNL